MIPFPDKKYSVIYADPPWQYQDKKCNGNAADHYPTMKIDDICNLPVKDLAADDCVHTPKNQILQEIRSKSLWGGSLLHRAFCKEYNTGLGCLGKRGK